METDTNPIDRSIAHLLFHRPADPSMLPLNDPVPFKSSSMVCFRELLTCFNKVDSSFLLLVSFSGLTSRYKDQ